MHSDFSVVVEPGLFVIFDLHSSEWITVKTYEELILISDSEFLSDDFQKRSLLKKTRIFLSPLLKFRILLMVFCIWAYHHRLRPISSINSKFHGKISICSGVTTFSICTEVFAKCSENSNRHDSRTDRYFLMKFGIYRQNST